MTVDDEPLLVRPVRYAGFVTLIVFGFLAWIAAGCLALLPRPPLWSAAALVGAAGLALVLAGSFWAVVEYGRRVWLTLQADGFTLNDRHGERAYRDDQIVSMTIRRRKNYSEGLLKSITRDFLLWAATDEPLPEQLTLTNTYKPEDGDPLSDFLQRIGDQLLTRARQEWAGGQRVLGEGWTLDRTALTVTEGKEVTAIALADLIAVDLVDDHVCLWERGEDEAVARVPIKAANAHLLLLLLAEYLEKNPREDDAPGGDRLGRIVFERRATGSTFRVLALLTAALALVGLLMAVPALKEPGFLIATLVLWGIAALTGLGAYYTRVAFFRCHAAGVHLKSLFGDRRLRFADVESFTYHAVRHFYNGAYTGTVYTLTLVPKPEAGGDKVRYSVNLRHADDELDNLRDHVAKVIARRMLADLRAGRAVRWTANLRFLRRGLEFRPSGWIGRKDPQVLPYAQIHGTDLQQGVFYLWSKADPKKAVFQEEVGTANFFPGLELLHLILAAPDVLKADAAAAVEVVPDEDGNGPVVEVVPEDE